MIEKDIFAALQSLVAGQVFPDVAPSGTKLPWITYQAVGGADASSLDGANPLFNVRMQITVWSDSRLGASQLMNEAIPILCAAPIKGVPIGAAVSDYDDESPSYGSRLDFSIWYTP